MKVWNWHREDGLAPMNGGFGLSGTITKASCHDKIRGETYPVLGAGESAAGRHGQRLLPQAEAG